VRAAGHDATRIATAALQPIEMVLERRGFMPGLSAVPPAAFELLRGDYDVAHAFTVRDAAAALLWWRLAGRPVVFTCTEPINRATVAGTRLRFTAVTSAFERTQAAVAGDERVRASVDRWLALSPPVIAAADAAAYEQLYRG
jgi:hypothetical protein